MDDDAGERARARILAGLTMLMAAVSLAHGHAPEPAARAPMRVEHPAPAARALREGQRVDLNGADIPTLELLPGIGPALARRIAQSRSERGDFGTLSDLARVRGIGERKIEALRPLVEVRRSASPAPGAQGAEPQQ